MSTDLNPANDLQAGVPELTELGKTIEVLRIQRGLSKQHLARFAGASRQQLWRVLTGKSDLTDALARRLEQALGVPTDTLRRDRAPGLVSSAATLQPLASRLTDPEELKALFAVLPAGPEGLRLKRALLDVAEELCLAARQPLPAGVAALRQRVLTEAVA